MKLVEEIGEVAEAFNQLNGRKKRFKHFSEKELADVIHYVLGIASVNNIDMTSIILEKDKEAAIKYGHKKKLRRIHK